MTGCRMSKLSKFATNFVPSLVVNVAIDNRREAGHKGRLILRAEISVRHCGTTLLHGVSPFRTPELMAMP